MVRLDLRGDGSFWESELQCQIEPDTEETHETVGCRLTRAVLMGAQHLDGLKRERASDYAAEIKKALLTVEKNPPHVYS